MTGSISENVGNRATVAAIIIAMAAVRKCLRRNEREPNCLLFNDVIFIYFEKITFPYKLQCYSDAPQQTCCAGHGVLFGFRVWLCCIP